jgi:hypothetical protein
MNVFLKIFFAMQSPPVAEHLRPGVVGDFGEVEVCEIVIHTEHFVLGWCSLDSHNLDLPQRRMHKCTGGEERRESEREGPAISTDEIMQREERTSWSTLLSPGKSGWQSSSSAKTQPYDHVSMAVV